MEIDFDKQINRYNSNSVKYDLWKENNKPEGIIPLWVADMDFSMADCVKDALTNILERGILGYTVPGEGYYTAVQNWYRNRFGWNTKKEWILTMPGVVTAIAFCIRCYTKEGDSILIQQPVYHLFRNMIETNNRKVVDNTLIKIDGQYKMNLEDFEEKVVKEQVKMYILCSPQNPVGRVWTKEELKAVGEICLRHNVLVVSDEIHGDFVYPGHRHHVFADVLPELIERTIICTAPSKSFNLAGMQTSNIFIPNTQLRERMKLELDRTHIGGVGIMGYAACEAAYTQGEDWLNQILIYIRGNYQYIREYLKKNIPEVTIGDLEGTYLGWMDFSKLGLTEEELDELCVEKSKIWFDEGRMFGKAGEGYERINLACPRSVLQQAMKQLKEALYGTV
ncbi:MAG: MalY/PatB family protein [Lachnospiraceae bacterium]